MCTYWRPGSKATSRANISNRARLGSERNTLPDRREILPKSSLQPPRAPYPHTPAPAQSIHPQSPNVRSRQVDADGGDKRDEETLLDDDVIDAIVTYILIK